MKTFWCEPRPCNSFGSIVSTSELSHAEIATEDNHVAKDRALKRKSEMLIDWTVDVFRDILLKIVAKRQADAIHFPKQTDMHVRDTASNRNPILEVTDILQAPDEQLCISAGNVQLKDSAMAQLRDLITSIVASYHDHPFHNFEHCCHVTMSTLKMLDRMAVNSDDVQDRPTRNRHEMQFDPLTQFAIVFGALIHDVDHPGVSNAQLVKENNALAQAYDGRSVAEQNSVDVAWCLLMNPHFSELQNCLFATPDDLQRLRQVVVNAVMATDLFDSDLNAKRDACWEKSFRRTECVDEVLTCDDTMRRKTIVLQLIIQASDVSHTMQHFTVYKKWNKRLMKEMYAAFQCGRMLKDPTESWYEGELWFFDNYVIPLAQKLRECKVFGVSCDEFLDYARDNRNEWEIKGREIVQLAVAELRSTSS
jgi:3'5'-cyclic nucleotide phosphodiesterase